MHISRLDIPLDSSSFSPPPPVSADLLLFKAVFSAAKYGVGGIHVGMIGGTLVIIVVGDHVGKHRSKRSFYHFRAYIVGVSDNAGVEMKGLLCPEL